MNKVLTPPKGIIIKSKVRFGRPIVANTRITVADILGLVEAGYRIDEVPVQYPVVSLKAARQALRYAADILGKEEVLMISA